MALPESNQPHHYTIEEYLAIEREATEIKHEYADGEIIAMTGASFNHTLICTNISTAFNVALRDSPCTVHDSNLKIRSEIGKSYRYPDVVVVCGKPILDDTNPPTLYNPTVLVEVLSPSTEVIDRNSKLKEYRAIPSLQAYLLVSQDEQKVEYYLRDPNDPDWRYNAVTDPMGSFTLPNPACTIAMSDVYRKVVI